MKMEHMVKGPGLTDTAATLAQAHGGERRDQRRGVSAVVGGDDPKTMTKEARGHEVVRILALGLLRLATRAALAPTSVMPAGPKLPSESYPDSLEVSNPTVLSVPTG
jgi:hypothetical protein